MKIPALASILLLTASLAGCATDQQKPNAPAGRSPAPPAALPPTTSTAPPDIFNILVDGKMYNHMDDARRAMEEQEGRVLAGITPAPAPRFGTLLVIAPPAHVPALAIPNATPSYLEKLSSFMAFLDSHNYEMNVAALRKSNNFTNVVLQRSAGKIASMEPEPDFTISYQQDGARLAWWIKRPGRDRTRLKADLGQGSIENALTLVAETSN